MKSNIIKASQKLHIVQMMAPISTGLDIEK